MMERFLTLFALCLLLGCGERAPAPPTMLPMGSHASDVEAIPFTEMLQTATDAELQTGIQTLESYLDTWRKVIKDDPSVGDPKDLIPEDWSGSPKAFAAERIKSHKRHIRFLKEEIKNRERQRSEIDS